MTQTVSREIRLKNRPEGLPRETDFEWKETVVDGIENAPKAFTGLFKGENFGKMIVKIGPDPRN